MPGCVFDIDDGRATIAKRAGSALKFYAPSPPLNHFRFAAANSQFARFQKASTYFARALR